MSYFLNDFEEKSALKFYDSLIMEDKKQQSWKDKKKREFQKAMRDYWMLSSKRSGIVSTLLLRTNSDREVSLWKELSECDNKLSYAHWKCEEIIAFIKRNNLEVEFYAEIEEYSNFVMNNEDLRHENSYELRDDGRYY